MAGCLLFFFFFQVLIKGTLSGKRRALKCCTNPGGSLRTTAASRTARVPLVRRVLEGAARRARRRAQGRPPRSPLPACSAGRAPRREDPTPRTWDPRRSHLPKVPRALICMSLRKMNPTDRRSLATTAPNVRAS